MSGVMAFVTRAYNLHHCTTEPLEIEQNLDGGRLGRGAGGRGGVASCHCGAHIVKILIEPASIFTDWPNVRRT